MDEQPKCPALIVVAIVNSAAMITGVHASFWIMVFFSYFPSSGIAESYGSSIFSVLWNLDMVLLDTEWLYRFTFPPSVQEHSFFSIPSLAFIVHRLFNHGHSDQCEVIPHCGFHLHFSNILQCWASFHTPFGVTSIYIIPFFNWVFFYIELYELFIYFGN